MSGSNVGDATPQVDGRPGVLAGTPVVPGAGYGPVIRPGARPPVPARRADLPAADRPAEKERFLAAAETVSTRLLARADAVAGAGAEVLRATAAMATDRGWLGAAGSLVDGGERAESAVAAATEQFVAAFTKLGGLMAERVTDLLDVRDRVLAELAGAPEPGIPTPEVPSVLLATDLAPADTAVLDPARVLAIATTLGGPTSHTAIIARQLGIPCVVAVAGLDAVEPGAVVLVDGEAGLVEVEPAPERAVAAAAHAAEVRRRTESWTGPGRTRDGHPVAVLANVQDGASARAAASSAAEGVGLLRTELAFLDRDTEPTVEEQALIYREVFDAFAGGKVVVRTLDAGSDKPLRFAGPVDEPNPALGVRGYRIAAANPGILDRQLDAIALAALDSPASVLVMAPMIATAAEAAEFATAARARSLVPGVMVEIPAAALMADRILEHVDFLSLGTNDLTQYTMAADRLSAPLAALTDPWQPAVLALVARTVADGSRAGKAVGVCGEAAADPLLACVLAGVGVASLSMAASAIAATGSALSEVDLDACRRAADAALGAADPHTARTRAAEILRG
ncbi:phosphoenolpyruvate--protein phosphotransferase [Rhodococcus sp. NPDC127528]|uniref:phosphoenolpyruvate--protein phosphotransferase n=1 Tax=unclassified Rhodococcus (in: high G+C Gram-positive bacteria) TaxID=192944 RepID=UPI00363AB9EA